MATMREMMERWQAVNAVEITTEAMGENSDSIAELNKEQLLSGQAMDGSPFYQYKDPAYAKMKNELNPLPGYGNADFKLTGAFQGGIFLKIVGVDYTLDSADDKTQKLKRLSRGAPLFGLSDENKKIAWANIIRNPFVDKLSEITGCPVISS